MARLNLGIEGLVTIGIDQVEISNKLFVPEKEPKKVDSWMEEWNAKKKAAFEEAELRMQDVVPFQWYEIESAPMDGRRILVYEEGETYVSNFCIHDKEWQIPRDAENNRAYDSCYDGELGIATLNPSHWMLVPESPVIEKVEKKEEYRHYGNPNDASMVCNSDGSSYMINCNGIFEMSPPNK